MALATLSDPLVQAHATLRHGCAFVIRHLGHCGSADLLDGTVAMRLTGNRLRELDRFLALTVEAAAAIAIPGHDAPAFARLRNTPNKLRTVRAALGHASPDHLRLCAAGRLRDRLHHGAGRGRIAPLGGDDLAAICRLHARSGDELMALLSGRHGPAIDFRNASAHIDDANVACDGMMPFGKSFHFTLPALPVHLPADHIFS